jgi:N-acetylmuramoyl-L-alanine amidase
MRRLLVWIVLVMAVRPATGAVLERVRVVNGAAPVVRLELSSPVPAGTATPLPADGERPARVYLDLPATTLAPGATAVAGTGDLLRVRTGQFDPTTVRVVLDLATPSPFAVRTDGRTITITLDAAPAAFRRRAPEPLVRPRERAPAAAASTIVLDAGHGGHDPGATGIDGVVEKRVALDVALRVAERLRERTPHAVVLTRTDDTYLSIDERIARASGAALFVSLHANAAADTTLAGVEVYYGGGGIVPVAAGADPAARLGREMVTAVERRFPTARITVHPGGFGVLARNLVPSVLVEIGYLTNPADAARLGDPRYRSLVAEAVADGVVAYLRDRPTLGIASR